MTTDIREELRQTVAQLAALTARRDRLIGEAVAYGIRVTDVAADAGLSRERIYQIRSGTEATDGQPD